MVNVSSRRREQLSFIAQLDNNVAPATKCALMVRVAVPTVHFFAFFKAAALPFLVFRYDIQEARGCRRRWRWRQPPSIIAMMLRVTIL